MSAEVFKFPGLTVIPLTARTIFDAAPDDLPLALVLGKFDTDELYMAGTHSDMAEVLLLLERAKMQVLTMVENGVTRRYV